MSYDATCNLSEMNKQADIRSAFATLTGANLQNAVHLAERRHQARCWAAAKPAGLTSSQQFAQLHSEIVPGETFTRSDNTAFTLKGWTYAVTVTATWNDTGTVVLQDASSGTHLTWTEDGTQTIELPPAVYHFTIDTATDVAATVTTGVYTDGSGEV